MISKSCFSRDQIKCFVVCLFVFFTLLKLLLMARTKESIHEFFHNFSFLLLYFFWSEKEKWMVQIIFSADNCSCLRIVIREVEKCTRSPADH